METAKHILCINVGSSSVKYTHYGDESLPVTVCVHRLVHGGPYRFDPLIITDPIRDELNNLVDWAPLHLPKQLYAIDKMREKYPDAVQMACFDTAFHRRMPRIATQYPLPSQFYDEGVKRYGFHGLSYESVVNQLGDDIKGKIIIAHLGSGCSMVALLDGDPQDTTMGLTPTGGMMMGTRCGDIDPGVLFYLLKRYTVDEVEKLLNQESGLLGISGVTSNMKELLASDSESAKQAINLFVYNAKKSLGALIAVLGGLDLLVFTGGIGENCSTIRDRIGEGVKNIRVVHTDENRVMANKSHLFVS